VTSPQGESAQTQAQAQVPGQSQSSSAAAESQQGAQLQASAAGSAPANSLPAPDGGEVGEDWSKLPSKVAKDIVEAQRQGVSPEYRSAVESYYKAIADRARRNKKP